MRYFGKVNDIFIYTYLIGEGSMNEENKPTKKSDTEKFTQSLGWGLLDSKQDTNPIKSIISPRVKIIVKHTSNTGK